MHTCTLRLARRKGSPNWQVIGIYKGQRRRITTGTRNRGQAQLAMAQIISELDYKERNDDKKQATMTEVADVHLNLITKKTKNKDKEYAKKLEPYIGDMRMNDIGMRPKQVRDCELHVLNQYIQDRADSNISVTTINKELAFLNLIGNKAVKEYGLLDYWTSLR